MATQTLSAGELELNVADLPAHIQRTVEFYDSSLEQRAKAETDFVLANAASRQLLNEISRLVDEHLKGTQESTKEVVEATDEECEECDSH